MITALLLAAGAAHRFGAPKLLEDLNGKPLVRWSAESLRGAPVDEILVVVPRKHDGFRRALDGIAARFAVNEHADRGIGTSIACGVAALSPNTQAMLVALADEPLAGRQGVNRVVERYRQRRASGDTAGAEEKVKIVVPTYGGIRGHPVLFDRSVFEELRTLSGDFGARDVTDRDPTRVAFVELYAPKPVDVDTREDLDRLRSEGPGPRSSLLDHLMPTFDVRTSHSTSVRAPVDVVYRAVLETDLAKSLLARTLMAIRSLGRRAAESFRFGELPTRGAFFALASAPPREVVAGIIGRFWALSGGVCEGDRDSFRAPLVPGTAKAAWSFRVDETDAGALLTTETRVLCADDEGRQQFRRYWTLVGPFSGVIRKEALRLIRAQAQFTSSTTQPS